MVASPVSLWIGQTGIGLELDYVVPFNASLTFVFFVAWALLAVLGARFAYYAYVNAEQARERDRAAIWMGLVLAGVAAAVYAALGVLDVVSPLDTEFRRGFLLLHVLILAWVIQQLVARIEGEEGLTWPAMDDRGWLAGFGLVGLVTIGTGLALEHPFVLFLQGAGGAWFGTVAVVVGQRAIADARVRGTVMGTLLRHLVPVALFAGTTLALDLATIPLELFSTGLDRALVMHVQVVFVVVTATALASATIRLQQNLIGR